MNVLLQALERDGYETEQSNAVRILRSMVRSLRDGDKASDGVQLSQVGWVGGGYAEWFPYAVVLVVWPWGAARIRKGGGGWCGLGVVRRAGGSCG